MKRHYLLFTALLLCFFFGLSNESFAANSKTEVQQVVEPVDVTGDVDYIITGSTPFGSVGSVNIVDTEHAVVIIKSIKPSLVIKNHLNHVFIKGEKAVDGTNCQVKMYGRGAIIFPYEKDFLPLTCYTEQNYGGESCNNYTEGNSGGYMKTLGSATLNNKIRSFKLKRGYMVTFAVGTAGWGWSRCFIADQADLEVPTLSNILDQHISSYRLFKWFNAHKAGLASDGRTAANQAVNSSWCYDWAQGNTSTLPDTEWVPNHIYEDYPGMGSIGGRDGTCHSKNNNEPGNSSDDRPQDVETVLNNWQNIMRTGLRLCSETSHDGSMSHLKEFIDSIDARGWRCDILDLHCYWASGTFNSLTWYSDNYGKGRPIWISEWVWGASWNNNGIFGAVSDRSSTSAETQKKCYDGTKPILDVLNKNSRVERYAYWNSEANCSKIYLSNGTLTTLGKYYSTMDVPLGYNPANEFIPRDHRMESLGELSASYVRSSGYVNLAWTDPNGDLSTTITIQAKKPNSSIWSAIDTVEPKDKSTARGAVYSYHHTPEEPGLYTYRILVKGYNNKSLRSNEATISIDPSQGTDTFQHGKLQILDTEEAKTYFSESQKSIPRVFIGTRLNKNNTFYASNVTSATIDRTSFTYQLKPWAINKGTISTPEEVPFMAIPVGNYDFGGLQCEVGDARSGKSLDDDYSTTSTIEVTFAEPFPEGVTPIVLTEIRNPNIANSGACIRVFDVTNTGFKFILYMESGCNKLSLTKSVCYFAVAPGTGVIDEENNIYIAAGHGIDNQIYGSSIRLNNLKCPQLNPSTGEYEEAQVYVLNPTIFVALQTNNYPGLCQVRRSNTTSKDNEGTTWVNGLYTIRVMEHSITVDGKTISPTSNSEDYTAYRENMGWVAICSSLKNDFEPATGINTVNTDEFMPLVEDGRITVEGNTNFKIYSLSGVQVPTSDRLEPGIYIIRSNGKSKKVVVR